ncbi:TPA: LPXTG cell wall anchor domain-containing protein [Streptococcus agalactiae]|uniref:LPXTG cell wall anchor domain-containing protein n=1 Tax=Streptococcus agalactiae TaxID=1311 RepID=UPI0020065281|nr:LPXTG cell wall anchor domain-containing protein [Streptococcus agalactiae]MCC9834009.1 LPXTG cell wall anchor domain-containing protein [Streptococcus agalactiae]MCK6242571.1 LPXTG cell wall anchor domain-containing protein [Streptococcus agalactiae]MCK6271869.1 LPXTG cell wall anchor domain-containing protein [Streptococcus agalactiae]MCK6323775.1 LPXTG cell wall anchor domain-containing protein [Streptococcus agalactiae]MCK6360754.1 LPXTG cell wall anchor domain-containing protein [Strep
MSKVKVLSLITVSGLFLMAGNLSASADVVTSGGDTIMLSGVDAGVSDSITPPPSSINPVTDTIEPSAPTPSTDPITDTTEPSAPTPSTDPITDTTEPSAPTPSTDQTTDTTDSSTSAPSTEAEKPAPSKEPDAPKPITKPIVDVPISTVTGDTVIGTENGKVIVQSASGTILKDAKEVGGEVQKDGTVAIKKSDGKIEVLPNTGEGKTIFTIVGLLLIAGAVWIGFKDNIKKYLTFFKKKSEK